MQLLCQQCGASFSIDDALVPPEGGSVPCTACGKPLAVGWPDLELDDSPGQSAAVPSPRAPVPVVPERSQPSTQPSTPVERKASRRPRDVSGAVALDVGGRRRAVALVGGAVLGIALAMSLIWIARRPAAPPGMPNPLEDQVKQWRAAGQHATVPTAAQGARQARAALAEGSEASLRKALSSSRAALLLDANDAEAVAVYGLALAAQTDAVEPEDLQVALGGVTSLVASNASGPRRARLEEARAALFVRLDKLDSARQAANQALRFDPSSTWAHLAAARASIPRQPDDAVARLETLKGDDVSAGALASVRARALVGVGKVAAARDVLTRCQRGVASDAVCLRELGRLELHLGRRAEALALVQRITAAGWAAAEDHIVAARLLSRWRHDASSAREHLDAAGKISGLAELSRARLAAERAMVLAMAVSAQWRGAEATAWLDEALVRAPDLPELLYGAALFDERAGRTAVALDSLEAAHSLAPERAEVALRFGMALRASDRQAASKAVEAAISESPDYVPLRLLRALMLYENGAKVAALQTINEALRIDPDGYANRNRLDAFADPPAAHLELGRLLGREGQRDRNVPMLTAAAMATYFSGDPARSQRATAVALRVDSRDVGARIYRALLLARRGQLVKAAPDLAVALRGDSRQPVARLYQARVLLARRTPRPARAIFEDLIAQNPLDIGARGGLAQALADVGETSAAREEALRVLSMRPNDEAALQLLMRLDRPVASAGR